MSQQADQHVPTDQHVQRLPERLPVGRAFVGSRKVRLGDVSPKGRLRFDALTRYTQDVSNDDTTDAGMDDIPGWVVRSTVIDEISPAGFGETLTFTTFCAGLSKRWADRRLNVIGDQGARYEVSTLWVCVDHQTGQPHALTQQFLDIYGEAAGDRSASARQRNPKLRTFDTTALVSERWQLRKVDFDTQGHVNNAAYWATVEQWLAEAAPSPRRVRLEYGQGITRAPDVEVRRRSGGDAFLLWWIQDEAVAGSASVAALPGGLYGDTSVEDAGIV